MIPTPHATQAIRVKRVIRYSSPSAWVGLLMVLLHATTASASTLVAYGSTWKYLDNGSDQGSAWSAPAFDDSLWGSGPAQLGYGDGDEATVVSYGSSIANKHITTYFRRTFSAANVASLLSATLRLVRDDGVIVYINGIEAFRSNMPAGSVSHTTLASSAISGTDETQPAIGAISPTLLVEGSNTIAVEIHQVGATSSDISFDLELVASDSTVLVTRGPYLQNAAPEHITLRWRTDNASDSRVLYGDSPSNLTQTASDAISSTEHTVTVSGLSPATRYYYAIGTGTSILAGADSSHTFFTSPATGNTAAKRIWVLGDSGTADSNAAAVRTAYDGYAGVSATDLWLMLGDNAYSSGTDSQYQAAVFDMYPEYLRRLPLWPTFGNHDAASAASATQSGPYYDIFNLPTFGESGGVPSGSEAYYSFDYGNIHFICLNSQDVDRSATGAMLTWLSDDLLATNSDWVIAFWHHPPYSKGSHNSDSETALTEMRQNALPILEAFGVDLVLTGHSHAYERSVLLDAHYGLSNTLSGSMILDAGDGRLDGNGAYAKATQGMAAHEGAVYVVAGSSGQLGGGALNHPAMYVSLLSLGSVVLDVNSNVLTARFLDSAGSVADHFTVIKGGPLCGNALKEAGEACDQTDLSGDTCLSQGCTGGTLACAVDCGTFDLSACTSCPSMTYTPTLTPTITPTPTRTPTVTPTAVPTASTHDSVVLALKPLSITLSGGNDLVKRINVKVRNGDAAGSSGHVVRLDAASGDCPALLIDSGPDFDPRIAGLQPSLFIAAGKTKRARLSLRFRQVDFPTHNHLTPTRCTLLLTASTDGAANNDPVASNDTIPLEINVFDHSAAESALTHESVINTPKLVHLRIADGASSATRHADIKLLNADILPSPEGATHPMSVTVNEAAGTCPAGSVTVTSSNPLNASGGNSASAAISVVADTASFHSGNHKSPARCVAVVEVSTDVPANSEPAPSNNSTRLLIQVDDRNDY